MSWLSNTLSSGIESWSHSICWTLTASFILENVPSYFAWLRQTTADRPTCVSTRQLPGSKHAFLFWVYVCLLMSICNQTSNVDKPTVYTAPGIVFGVGGGGGVSEVSEVLQHDWIKLWLCFMLVSTRWRWAVVFPASFMWGVQVGQGWYSSKGVLGLLYTS